MKKNNKIVVKSDVEFAVKETVEGEISLQIKKIVDEMSKKFMRNIEVKITVEVE